MHDVRVTDSGPSQTLGQTSDSLTELPADLVIQPMVRRSHHSLVGGLASAIVHMLILIGAGLLFAAVQHDGAVELQLVVANTNATESFEDLSIEVDLASVTPTSKTEIVGVASEQSVVRVSEPTLTSEVGEIAVSDDDFDAMAPLSKPVTMTSESESGKKSDHKGSFFGAEAYGDEFVYVVDMSTSMGARSQYGQTRFRIACRELLRSINELTPSQKFCVFMFCYRTRVMFDAKPMMLSATNANKQRVARWINGLGLGAGTDPRYGTMMALRLKPDAIFLLSDGEFNGREVNAHGIAGNPPIETLLHRQRKSKVPIHTIAFEDMLSRKRMRRIAHGTLATHRFVGHMSDQELLIDDLLSNNRADIAYGLRSILDETQKLRDDQQVERATRLIAGHFTSRDESIRALAYQTMLFVADGDDMGPSSEEASHREFAKARKKWLTYWKDRLKKNRLGKDGGKKRSTVVTRL